MTGDPSPLFYDPMGMILLLVALALLPFVAMMVTSFIKLVVVMNLLRQAIGLQQVPPNMVINGLAVILTLYIMAPTLQESVQRISETHSVLEARKNQPNTFTLPPHIQTFLKKPSNPDWNSSMITGLFKESNRNKVGELQAIIDYTKQPLVDFLSRHTTDKHRAFFMHIAKKLWPPSYLKDLKETDLVICIPAFVISELTAGFEIGFLIYLPFVTIDLIVSNILLAMGMMMVSPMTISLPFKLMLFVLISGWDKIVEALALTYR